MAAKKKPMTQPRPRKVPRFHTAREEGEWYDRRGAAGELDRLVGWKPLESELGLRATRAVRIPALRLRPEELEAASRLAKRKGVTLPALVSAWVREGLARVSPSR